ncbi:hypothetical protein PQR37_19765 [Paraburkholderia nemoris]
MYRTRMWRGCRDKCSATGYPINKLTTVEVTLISKVLRKTFRKSEL